MTNDTQDKQPAEQQPGVPRCNLCGVPMTGGKHHDCGGDCLRCMAMVGDDPDCMRQLLALYEDSAGAAGAAGAARECECCGRTDECDDDRDAVVIGGRHSAPPQPMAKGEPTAWLVTATKDAPGFVKPYRVLKWTLDEAAKQAEHLQEVGCTVTVEPLVRSATLVEALEAALR